VRTLAEGRIPPAVAWGLLVAWAVHDAEELLTTPTWVARARPRLERRLPAVPPAVWDLLSPGRAHAALAIGLVGTVVAAAAADGARTGGRSAFFQAVLDGFGAHAAGHLASAAVTGGYTPGLATAPTVVVPFAWWARRRLRAAGVPRAAVPTAALALVPVTIVAAQATAAGLLWLVRR
jgi:hypothetical protein